ncbi:MAG TPA: PKD domain-containing protein [Thermoleophilaceae bacterium]|nr:PKD domain-containing protein [Thermoleophilaceae bacterium]
MLLGSYTSGICPTAANTVDCIPSDYDSHSIGTVRSAPDGTLFVGSGDGASYAAADRRALRTYDEQSMAGKILHIDREGRGVAGHPMCASNANLAHVCTKVWAKGLRNPFRFSLRPDGGVNIGDVGWNVTEELNVAPAAGGRSYGWPCFEGTTRTSGYSGFSECAAEYAKPAGTHTGPTTSWCHCSSSASALGGPVYQGERYPAAYRGDSFYADYAKGWIKRLRPDGSTVDFASSWYSGVDLTTGPQGDLTFVSVGDFSAGSGSVVALRYPQGNRAPVARMTTDRTSGPAPLAVAFDGTTSSDADGDALTYKWEFGDGTTSTAAKPTKTYAAAGSYTAKLTVTDPAGLADSTSTTITAGNSAPTASIDSPADGSRYRDGAALTLRGSGTDVQDGALAGSRLSWQVVLNHGNHTHVESTLTGSQVSYTPRDDHDADSFYTVQLTATDSGGLTHKRTITIRPETVALKIDSQPAGAPVSWAGTDLTAPHTGTSAVGFKTAVGAAERFSSGGKTYVFDRWSDGGARSHAVTVPATALNLTAVYREESTPAPTGLVAALNFDEGSGAVARDQSGLSNHASLSGGAAFSASGRSGAAANFAGGSAQATIADNG